MQVKAALGNVHLSDRDCEMRRQHDELLVLQHCVGEALSRTADDLVVKQTKTKGFLTSFNQPTYHHLNLDSAEFSYWCKQLSPGNTSLSSSCIDQHQQVNF